MVSCEFCEVYVPVSEAVERSGKIFCSHEHSVAYFARKRSSWMGALFFHTIDDMWHSEAVIEFNQFSDFLHAISDSDILWGCIVVADDRVNFGQPKCLECVFFARQSCFGRISFMPVILVEQVTDFMDLSFSPFLESNPGLSDQLATGFENDGP